MATDLSTANVTDTKSGTGWTIDVTACNLLSDLSIKDFIMLIAGSLEPNSNITKTSQTVLTYNGASIGSSTVEVRRVTPQNRFQEIVYADKLSSTVYNEEIDRSIRRAYEYTLNGIGPGSTATIQTPLDDAYGVGWDADTIRPATRNALYDKFELMGDLADDEAITGNWTAPTQTDGNNSTRLATTAYVETHVTNELAGSPALGGNPTAATQAVDNNSTRIATTAFVQTQLENVPTATQGDTDESAANTRFTTEMVNPIAIATVRAAQVNSVATHGIVYTSEETDVNSIYNTTTGIFTIPTNGAGIYRVNASITLLQSSGSSQFYGFRASVGGVADKFMRQKRINTGVAEVMTGSTTLILSDADTVSIIVENYGTVSTTYGANNANQDYAVLERIGSVLAIA